jgi:UDP-N-acetylglucosamine diphosphorylase/glucosamine-1-phosphate N-acetyltransferase
LYDDDQAREFEPFVTTRPVSELLVGVANIRERWEEVLGLRAEGFISQPHLVEFQEERAPAYCSGFIPKGCIIANSRFVPALIDRRSESRVSSADAEVWTAEGRVAAVRVRDRVSAAELVDGRTRLDKMDAAGLRTVEIRGIWLNNVWDIIRYQPALLTSDIACLFAAGASPSPGLRSAPGEVIPSVRLREMAAVLGENPVLVASDAVIDPHVVFDARGGPILVSHGAVMHSFSRLEGPCYIGRETTVMAGRIAASAVGEKCKVSGEMSNTTMIGFSNKAHDGFIGHSCLGRWVNIGAGTITSNLKNTYGDVSLWTPSGVRGSGMQFLGTFFGDHARTGIGTMLPTGSVIGAGANVFGGGMPPRYVPPFSWGSARGEEFEAYDLEKFIEVAARVMARRNVPFSDGARRHYEEVYRRSRRDAMEAPR